MMLQLAAGIVVAAAFVIFSGAKLVRYGDALGGRIGLSRSWVGIVLLAALTSLPELVVTISAQLAASKPQLVMGNVIGSNLFNVTIFVLVDAMAPAAALSTLLSRSLIQTAIQGVLLMGMALAAMALFTYMPDAPWKMPVGFLVSFAVVGVYLYSMWKSERGEHESPEEEQGEDSLAAMGLGALLARFALLGVVLVASGTAFIMICDYIIEHPITIAGHEYRVNAGVVGTLLVAFVTSLPELVVCITAARIRAYDMAIGNVLGSNIFNVTLLSVAHVVRPTEPFWSVAEPMHLWTLCAAIALSLIVMAGIASRKSVPILRVGIDGWLIAIIGFGTMALVAMTGVE